ncbi:(Lyso)-N-acylphosphatidylethanolamine lipase-like [Antedon mediterranea]|uniref:(Lyso)-N-acylphosphatidylethanolamine lipase-like n=1 Tax=Antedon mediterranea TaxID=105859 RepID=UPI003AF4DB0A
MATVSYERTPTTETMQNPANESDKNTPEESNTEVRHSWLKCWVRTSNEMLNKSEQQILRLLKNKYKTWFVTTKNGDKIRTIYMNNTGREDLTPIVLVHGMAGAIGLWVQNLDALSNVRPVYAFDLLGFGRSTRRKFPAYAEDVEREFVGSIEQWREEVGLDKMILIGHSLGGFITYAYAIRYPERIKHLVPVDPWGFPERDEENEDTRQNSLLFRVVGTLALTFNPLSGLRAAGPFGQYLVSRMRPDLDRKFASVDSQNTVTKYIYHCNAQRPSGEEAFKFLQSRIAFAQNPMIQRITQLDKSVPITMLYGSKSWMDSEIGQVVKNLRNESQVTIKIVQGAGHHVYADKPDSFNKIVQNVCKQIPD